VAKKIPAAMTVPAVWQTQSPYASAACATGSPPPPLGCSCIPTISGDSISNCGPPAAAAAAASAAACSAATRAAASSAARISAARAAAEASASWVVCSSSNWSMTSLNSPEGSAVLTGLRRCSRRRWLSRLGSGLVGGSVRAAECRSEPPSPSRRRAVRSGSRLPRAKSIWAVQDSRRPSACSASRASRQLASWN
jgi:hypothetical protein